jgi:peptidoglycan/LPS O-acetylase OafA/YrhL
MTLNLSAFLDLSRWLSAFLVVIGHVRHLVLVDLKNVEERSIYVDLIYFVSGLGHEAVVVFFVISGYLVGGKALDKWIERWPDLRDYAIARFSRIYTVLIPALLVGLTIDAVGLYWFNSSELYTNSMQYQTDSLGREIASSMDASTFLGNLLFLQGILTGSLGSNGPLWSLSYEWWYYCIFALIGVSATSSSRFRLFYLLGAIALTYLLPEKLVVWGLIWLLGVGAYAWTKSGFHCPNFALGVAMLALAVVVSRTSHSVNTIASPESISRDFALGLSYVVALVGASRSSFVVRFKRLHGWLANFSYTTYIFHFPFMIFSVSVLYQVAGLQFRVQPDGEGLLYLFVELVVVYCYCYFWALVAEKHTDAVRSYLQLKFPRKLASESYSSVDSSGQEGKSA